MGRCMELKEMDFQGQLPVDGYAPGAFRVGGALHDGPLLLGPSGVSRWSGLDDLEPLADLAAAIDVLLLGMGSEIAPPPTGLRIRLEALDVGIEPMASPAACRTYNVLLSEGRRVALAALPI